jgi:acyl-homoserine lactone acylase PvdQ
MPPEKALRVRRILPALVAALVVSASVIVPASSRPPAIDDPGGFWNILPAGQEGTANVADAAAFLGGDARPAHWDDQVGMYDRLAREWPDLNARRLDRYFKRAGFRVPAKDVVSVEQPRPGLTIIRDRFGVPHIYGRSDNDVVWGAGYATADDRMFFADVLRHVGRGRLSEFLGASEANLAMDQSIWRVAGYTEEELQMQLDQLPRKFGAIGELSLQAFKTFADGMNAWINQATLDPGKLPAEYTALQVPLEPWKPTDSVAVAILVQATFAAGGGGEVDDATLLKTLYKKFPGDRERAERVYSDLLNREDPEAPVTTRGSFPYLDRPQRVDQRAIALPDLGSVSFENPLTTLREALADAGLPLPSAMSNWLAVDAAHAQGGRPIGVLGPQVGYFSPEVLMEIDLHGPTTNARGATFPGISLAVLLGRGIDFAWSATSGGSDLVDLRVERLCEPNGGKPSRASTAYVLEGVCVPMYQRTDRWVAKPSAGGVAEPTVVTARVQRTVHGPVIGTATVNGAPVAVSLQRSTWFGEVDSSPAFLLLNRNRVHDPQSFFRAMNYVTGSFNWLYVGPRDVAYFHSGLYPVRAPGVDPELPTWGTGQWEWRGFMPLERHPHVTVGPQPGSGQGYIASWNNKPARGWRASDGNYSFGSIHRVQSLNEKLEQRLARKTRLSVTDLVQVMADAATVDLRGTQVLPWALSVLGNRADVRREVTLLTRWAASGAHRVDRDRNGHYEHEAAIALMDEWYDSMIDAVIGDELDGLPVPESRDDSNRIHHLGSAFQGGWYHWLEKSFRQALGTRVAAPLREVSCGGGTKAGCARVLARSLRVAVAGLAKRYGSSPNRWVVSKAMEDIRFTTVGVVGVDPMDWQNRPTFQQVVQVKRPRAS